MSGLHRRRIEQAGREGPARLPPRGQPHHASRDQVGQRPAETANAKPGLQWGVDHFGLRVKGDFDAFCTGLRGKGVTFSLDPVDFNPATRIAFINAPDGVSIELLNRKDQA